MCPQHKERIRSFRSARPCALALPAGEAALSVDVSVGERQREVVGAPFPQAAFTSLHVRVHLLFPGSLLACKCVCFSQRTPSPSRLRNSCGGCPWGRNVHRLPLFPGKLAVRPESCRAGLRYTQASWSGQVSPVRKAKRCRHRRWRRTPMGSRPQVVKQGAGASGAVD